MPIFDKYYSKQVYIFGQIQDKKYTSEIAHLLYVFWSLDPESRTR